MPINKHRCKYFMKMHIYPKWKSDILEYVHLVREKKMVPEVMDNTEKMK